jgi:hypothetical protein
MWKYKEIIFINCNITVSNNKSLPDFTNIMFGKCSNIGRDRTDADENKWKVGAGNI